MDDFIRNVDRTLAQDVENPGAESLHAGAIHLPPSPTFAVCDFVPGEG